MAAEIDLARKRGQITLGSGVDDAHAKVDGALLHRMDKLVSAVQLMASTMGTRLSRAQLAERLGVHRNTLAHRIASDRGFPRPGTDGKWLLSELVEWEQRRL